MLHLNRFTSPQMTITNCYLQLLEITCWPYIRLIDMQDKGVITTARRQRARRASDLRLVEMVQKITRISMERFEFQSQIEMNG